MVAILGVDIGGTGVKAAPVDVETGQLLGDRHRLKTPHPATPEALLAAVGDLRDHFDWNGRVGCTFPGVVRAGTILTAANLDASWIDVDLPAAISEELGLEAIAMNDADAAGVAELAFGAPEMSVGTVIVCTLGTGIGSAIFVDGHLIPNTEFGHLDLGGTEAEKLASARAREELQLSWEDWAANLATFLRELEKLMWPDLFVIGGGVSKKFDKYGSLLNVSTPVLRASLGNTAGIVGAALVAATAPEP